MAPEPLKLIPQNRPPSKADLADNMDTLSGNVEKLIAFNEILREEVDALREVIGLSELDYERFKATGRIDWGCSTLNSRVVRLNERIEEALAFAPDKVDHA